MTLPAPEHIKKNPVYSKIWWATRQHKKSFLGIITGKPGTGKSVSGGGRFLRDVDRKENGEPRFTIDKVVYDPKEFIQELKRKRPKGSGVLWDEAAVAIPRREWYSLKNRFISAVFQTMRIKHRVVILTMPSQMYIDRHIGPILEFWIHMYKNLTFANDVAKAKFWWTDWKEKLERVFTYWHKEYKDGLTFVYDKPFKLHKPPEDWCKEYDEKQEEAKSKLLDRADDLVAYMYKKVDKVERSDLTDAELYEIVKADLKNKGKKSEYLDADGKKVLTPRIMVKHKGLDYRIAARVAKVINDDIRKGVIVI